MHPSPECAICLDAGSISGTGACGACPCSTTDIAWRRRPTPAQSVSRVHLRCGHSFLSFIHAASSLLLVVTLPRLIPTRLMPHSRVPSATSTSQPTLRASLHV